MFKQFKYFSTLLVAMVAFIAAWQMWNIYMQGPWTRDGKVRVDIVNITPAVSGQLIHVKVKDNQLVKSGTLLFVIDPKPYEIALNNAEAELSKAKSDLDKAEHGANRRQNLANRVLSAEEVDEKKLDYESMKAVYLIKEAALERAKWDLEQTEIYAPTDGYITNLDVKPGNYAATGTPLVALVDNHSFYVMGYFEETKLKHIKIGTPAQVTLYGTGQVLKGEVESIGRAIHDQSLEGEGLLMDVQPNVPWVRLAQRIPVRIRLHNLSLDKTELIAGTTCTVNLSE